MLIAPTTFKLSIQTSPSGRVHINNLAYKSFSTFKPAFALPLVGMIFVIARTIVYAHKESISTSLTIFIALLIPASILISLPFSI